MHPSCCDHSRATPGDLTDCPPASLQIPSGPTPEAGGWVHSSFALGSHSFNLIRSLPDSQSAQNTPNSQDFGNWQHAGLSTGLTTDQSRLDAQGQIAPWSEGARLWLTAPSFADTTDLIAGYAIHTGAAGLNDPQNAPQNSLDLGFRQNAQKNLQFTLTSATRYYSSNEPIASVIHLATAVSTEYLNALDANGNPVTEATGTLGDVAIIGQSDITLNVQAAQVTDATAQSPSARSIDTSTVSSSGNLSKRTAFETPGNTVTINIPLGQSISSLAIAGDYLLIGEGNGYGYGTGGYRLLGLNTNPASANYHQNPISLKGTGIEAAPFGVAGMTVGPDGRTLVVSVPNARVRIGYAGYGVQRAAGGDVLVFDLQSLNLKTGKIDAPIKANLGGGTNPVQAPQTVTATQDRDRYLVTSLNNLDNGLNTLTLTRDETSGKVTAAKMASIRMNQSYSDVRVDRLDIQRAQSAVLVNKDGVDYAIVSDDNEFFMDAAWQAMYEVPTFMYLSPMGPPTAIGGSASAKKVSVGGKLGIVQDPFGKQGAPKFLGATLPLNGYGIVNLSLSEDGEVLIGQLKGGFSANILVENNSLPKEHQNHAWNVDALISAAVNMPDNKRKHDHIYLAPDVAQLIPAPTTAGGYVAWPAGTKFDPLTVNVSVTGRMGDVLEVDLKQKVADQVARSMLHLGTIAEGDMGGDERKMLRETKAELIRNGLTDFSLAIGTDWSIYSSAVPVDGMRIVGKLEVDQGSHSIQVPVLESRNANLEKVSFADEGRFYLVPNITDANLTTLQQGGRISASKSISGLSVHFRYKAADDQWEEGTAIISATANDIDAVNTFFGDRPLDNPGYSELKLKGEVSVAKAKSGQIDVLDVYKVEQRLKYLGFPAMGASSINAAGTLVSPDRSNNEIQSFDVDGTWGESEARAAFLFKKVVNYDSNAPTTTKLVAHLSGSAFNANSYYTDLTKAVTSFSFSMQTNATDKVVTYLNAYNAPHWMALFAVPIPGWNNTQTEVSSAQRPGETDKAWKTRTGQVERYGTSWMRDLMVAAGSGPQGLSSGNRLTFNGAVDANQGFTPSGHGSHDVGMAFDLGISDYIERLRPNPLWNSNSPATVPKYLPITSQSNTAEAVAVLPTPSQTWSISRAINQATQTQLPQAVQYMQGNVNMGRNRQQSAIKDFLSLYSVVRDDSTSVVVDGVTQTVAVAGSRGSLTIRSGSEAQKKLIRTSLFGDGSLTGSLIRQVLVGGDTALGQNPLANIGQALTNLGITNGTYRDHQNHFHIYLKSPTAQPIDTGGHALLAGSTESGNPNASLTTGEAVGETIPINQEMFMLDYFVPPQISNEAPVLVAQAGASKPKTLKPFTVCQDISGGIPDSAFNQFSIFGYGELKKPELIPSHKVRLLQAPVHGRVTLNDEEQTLVTETATNFKWPVLAYLPTQDYVGKDRAVFLVEANNRKYQVTVNFWVMPFVSDAYEENFFCKQQKFSSINFGQENLPAWVNSAELSALLSAASGVTYGFSDLAGSTVGTTVGQGEAAQITLDTTAAGHGWYIDPTPLDNTDDYLPTSDPSIWQAKAGSAAEGKMDMLSVLLHEYGHALGLDHTADSHDFMAETLQAGQRKLPTADELQLMADLVAQLKGDAPASPDQPSAPGLPGSLALAGLLSARRKDTSSALLSQKLVSVNPTLQNTNFAQGNTQGWSVDGNVNLNANGAVSADAASNTVTLLETSTSQTSLMQAFTLGAKDRFLSFTVDHLNLGSSTTNAPADAFEVALLDATSYDPLLGNLGLSHSDAALNLQHDTTGAMQERETTAVHSVSNPDGSTTYTLDLRSLSASRSVLLSFDLLGFGAADSSVTLRNIHMSSAPQAVDDTLSVLEDTPTTFTPLTNDVDADQPGVVPSIVANPQHGSVLINPDGSFTYTPDANYNGADSFSYHIGPQAGGTEGVDISNTAMVNINVTAVNDAPVASDVSATSAEDTVITIKLIAVDAHSTVDGAKLGPNRNPQLQQLERFLCRKMSGYAALT